MQSSATMWLGSMWSAKRAWCMSFGQRIKGTPTSWINSTQAITSDLSCRFPPSGILRVVLWIRHWGPTRTSCFTLEVSIYLAFESSVQYNIAVSYLTCSLLSAHWSRFDSTKIELSWVFSYSSEHWAVSCMIGFKWTWEVRNCKKECFVALPSSCVTIKWVCTVHFSGVLTSVS